MTEKSPSGDGVRRSPESRSDSAARLRSEVDRLLEQTGPEGVGTRRTAPRRGAGRAVPGFFDGEVLAGRYRVIRFIASGGVGEVYEAEDLEEGRRVALKTVRREVASDADIMERFRRELRYAQRMEHPNICRIFELDQHTPAAQGDPVTFLTMELLEGGTLEDLLSYTQRLESDQALTIVEQIVSGLSAAHAAGIVHRDLKAGNVMLVRPEDDREGVRVVLTDFGLAHGALEDVGSHDSSSLTRTGQIIGTPAYMAPEQLRGERASPATDIYALGLLMYETLVGARPFPGRNSFAAAVRRLEEAPDSPRDHLPEIDPRWERAILRCLEREPGDRFARVEEVVEILLGPFEPESAPVAPRDTGQEPSGGGKRMWIFLFAAVLVLAVVLLSIRGCSADAREESQSGEPPSIALHFAPQEGFGAAC